MGKRINIVLPETTLRTIDRIVAAGERSRFIDQAVQHFVAHQGAQAIRKQLERAVVRDRDLDREVTADWFAADQQAWAPFAEVNRKPATQASGNLRRGA